MHRTRLIAAGALALAMAAGPGALVTSAADTPDGAVSDVINAFVAKDFAAIPPLICESRREEIAADLDITTGFAESGMDPAIILDALTLSFADPLLEVVSQDETSATVHLTGTLTMAIALSEETARELVIALLEGSGMEVTDEMVEQYLPMLLESINQTQTEAVDEEVEVVNENGQWLMCDTLGSDEPEGSPGPSPVPSALPAESPAL